MSSFLGGLKPTRLANATIIAAEDLTKTHRHSQIDTCHLASALLTGLTQDEDGNPKEPDGTPLFQTVIEKANGDVIELGRGINKAVVSRPSQDPPVEDPKPSNNLRNVFAIAAKVAKGQKDSYMGIDHLIEGVLQSPSMTEILQRGGVTADVAIEMLHTIRADVRIDSEIADDKSQDGELSKFCMDMTARAREGKIDPVIGREEEIRNVIRILSRRTKNNPILIGEPGVGKTTIVEGLANRIVNHDVPDSLAEAKLLSLDVGALVAGSKYRGEFEERMKTILTSIENSDEMILLFVDEIHLLMGAGAAGEGGMDAANLLKPALARGQLHCIGATTLDEYRKYIEKDAAFARRFQQVLANEPSVPDTISILRGLKEKYENHHGVTITDGAIIAAATLAGRYLTSRRLPDSAVDLVDEAAAAVRVTRESQPEALDNLERRHRQLQIEIHALSRESEKDDKKSVERLKEAKKEANDLMEELTPLKARYEEEKSRTVAIQNAKNRLERYRNNLAIAERNNDIIKASDIMHNAIPEVELEIKQLEKKKAKAMQNLHKSDKDGETNALIADSVGSDQIAEIVGRWSGIPVASLKADESEKLMNMEAHLAAEVVGQDDAVAAITTAIQLQRAGLSNPNQPPSFLFCGPSGTGKTLLTKTLAKFLFNDPKAMIRFDMSEFQERHALSRMIGAPPGYVGHDAGGQLTEGLRRKPFSILLFDEIEKAAKEVLTVLLQLMDDGRITDGQGRVVNASNCIVIMTSNLGAEYLTRPDVSPNKKIPAATRELVMGALRNYFLPEFLNRISSVIIFNRLTRDGIRAIVDVNLKEIQKRLENNGRRITIEVSKEARDYLGREGYSPSYGARPLARLIQNEVLDPMAKLILSKRIRDEENVKVELYNNRIWVVPNHGKKVPPQPRVVEDDDDEEDEELYE